VEVGSSKFIGMESATNARWQAQGKAEETKGGKNWERDSLYCIVLYFTLFHFILSCIERNNGGNMLHYVFSCYNKQSDSEGRQSLSSPLPH